jgi:transcriptional regulator with XRE-family HTH domain
MNLGNSLFNARKKSGLSQEDVAEKLGVSRQTISKWELGDTLPDIQQSKRLSLLYHLSLDDLIDFDLDVQEIQEAIDKTSEAVSDKVDWTKAWGKKYPVLVTYQEKVDTIPYVKALESLLDDLQKKYGYNELDTFLVLKDIMASVWKKRSGKTK